MCWSAAADGEGAPAATGRRALRPGRDQLPARRPDGMREGADELLLGAVEARLDRGSPRVFDDRGVPPPRQPDRQPRALLQPLAEDLRPGTLPRRARPQARRVARFDAAGAVAGSGPVARELRPDLESVDPTARTTTWHTSHGRGDPHGPRVRLCEAHSCRRPGT